MSTVLSIIPYPIVPPRNGGALRCYHLLRQLARSFEVHAVIFQREAELRKGSNGYCIPENIHVYSPLDRPPPKTVFDRLPPRIAKGLQYRWLRRSWRGPAEEALLRAYHLVLGILKSRPIDAAIFEHLASMTVAPLVRRANPSALRILDAHNVDSDLLKQEMNNAAPGDSLATARKAWAAAAWLEAHLDRFVDTYFACSDADRDALSALSNVSGHIIPNGIDTKLTLWKAPCATRPHTLLFCGSLGYQPNIDGLNWFARDIWPLLKQDVPDVRLTVIGRGGQKKDFGALPTDPRVDWVGEVEDTLPFYHAASAQVCPLRMGSGTRLKILESMSAGTPVVSTSRGAEGIDVEPGTHLLIADEPDAFAAAVGELLRNDAKRLALSRAARALVESAYDWNVIGNRLAAILAERLSEHVRPLTA